MCKNIICKKPHSVRIFNSPLPKKKKTATFYNKQGKIIKTQHFGSFGMSDFTIHKDEERKERYLNRHRKRENWDNPLSAGALSRWILWNKPSLRESIKDFKNRFNLK